LIRTDLMKSCNLHTILRLPNGIFYSQGVNTNVLFFSRQDGAANNSRKIWVYDMRTGMPRFGKTRPLDSSHFKEFEALFGDDPHGRAQRTLQSGNERWRCFDREEIAAREDNLDLVWLTSNDDDEDAPDITPQEALSTVLYHLQFAMAEIEQLVDEFAPEEIER
jgi:type I restriction enzyme M protein